MSNLPADAAGPAGPTGHYHHWLSAAAALAGLAGEVEPPSELVGLRAALGADLAPRGTLENVLVDVMCTALWRWRRLLRLETALLTQSNQRPAEARDRPDAAAAERAQLQVERLRQRGRLSRAQERESRRIFGNLPPDQLFQRYLAHRVGVADQLQAALADQERQRAWLGLSPLASGAIPDLAAQEALLVEQLLGSLDRLLALRAAPAAAPAAVH